MADTPSREEIREEIRGVIEEQLRRMEPEQLALLAQIIRSLTTGASWGAWEALLAAELSLKKDWERAEEDAAWADL